MNMINDQRRWIFLTSWTFHLWLINLQCRTILIIQNTLPYIFWYFLISVNMTFCKSSVVICEYRLSRIVRIVGIIRLRCLCRLLLFRHDNLLVYFFVFNIFISFHNALFSSINNFNKHALIDHFHFNHEVRTKERLLNSVYKKSQSGQIISLPCSVIVQFNNCDVMWSLYWNF